MRLITFSCTLLLTFFGSVCFCQPNYDTSPKTQQMLNDFRDAANKLEPAFSGVPILIPLALKDSSNEFDPNALKVIISRSFLYYVLDYLKVFPARKLSLRQDHLDYDQLSLEQIEVPLLPAINHEFGHFMQKYYKDTLADTQGFVHPKLRSQQAEYTCDFVSGFASGKSLWLRIRDKLFKTCADGKTDNLIGLVLAVYNYKPVLLDTAFNCLEQFVAPYRTAELLIAKGGDCEHGLGSSRKNAFDAGIFYSIFDGISRETFEDTAVLNRIEPWLKIFGISRETLKQRFAVNLTRYLTERRGMTKAIVPVLRTYQGTELYVAAFAYCLSLPRNLDPSCHVTLGP